MDARQDLAVDSVLAAAGFRATARDPHGTWRAVALDGSRRRVELHVLPSDPATVARAHAFRLVRHEHLARVLEVVELDPGRVAVFAECPEGLRLDRLCAARDPLTPGEAATVAIPVAQALGTLHAAGLAHGAVSGDAVVVGSDGRPLLAGLGAALRHGGGRDGADADVRALLAVVLGHLGAERHGAAGDPPELGGLRGALEDLWREETIPAGRVVDRCFRAVAPAPVRLPSGPASAGAGPRGLPGARASRRRAAAEDRSAARDRAGARIAVGACVLALVATVTATVLLAPRSAEADGPAPVPTGVATPAARATASVRLAPADAAVALTERRVTLLRAGERAALQQVEVPGSPAHDADVRMLAALGEDRVEGLTVTVSEVETLDEGADEARVRVTSTTSAYARVAPDGSRRAGGPQATTTVVLVLRWTPNGWRVWDVTAG